MTCGDEVQAGLARFGHHALRWLSGEEGLRSGGGAVAQIVGARAGDDGQGAHRLRTLLEDERLACGRLGDAREQIARSEPRAGEVREDADRLVVVKREALEALSAQRACDQ